MSDRASPRLTTRKRPKQARSASLVADILEAAARVLAEEGAQRFTTSRVAERAGVSIGSLYQYFPNKASILFRLQADEWASTTALLCGILEQTSMAPPQRLQAAVHAFVRSECDEAAMRRALNDAAPLYRDAPEAREPRASGTRTMQAFLEAALPHASEATRNLAGDVIITTLSAQGKRISETQRSASDIERHAEAVAAMLCAYLESLS